MFLTASAACRQAAECSWILSLNFPSIRGMLEKMGGPTAGMQDVRLVLASLGLLTALAGCAERNCRAYCPRGRLPPANPEVEVAASFFPAVNALIGKAARGRQLAVAREAFQRLQSRPVLSDPAYWQRMQREVTELMAAALAAPAAEEGDPAAQLQLAVDVAEALATRPCARPCCTTVLLGAGEGGAPLGTRCGGCRVARYCGTACQSADWPAHKAACREVTKRRGGGAA